MDKYTYEQLEGLLVKAVQSTKAENGGLIGEMKTNIILLQDHYKDIKSTLEEIKTQTTRTNGTVVNLRLWRSYQLGGLAILTVIVLPLLIYIFNDKIENVEAQMYKIDTEHENILEKVQK